MRNKLFPTFEQDISASLKCSVLAITFFVIATWAIFAVHHAVTEYIKAYEAAAIKFYRGAKENDNAEENKGKYESHQAAATPKAKTQKNHTKVQAH